jgi:hypothetical protein
MISFGNGWTWDAGLLSHACDPKLSVPWPGQRASCACGSPVPRHARSFQRWIRRELRRAARDLKSAENAAHSNSPIDPLVVLHNPTYRT